MCKRVKWISRTVIREICRNAKYSRIVTLCFDQRANFDDLCGSGDGSMPKTNISELRFKKLSAFLQFSPDYSELYYSEPYKASFGTKIGHQSPLL